MWNLKENARLFYSLKKENNCPWTWRPVSELTKIKDVYFVKYISLDRNIFLLLRLWRAIHTHASREDATKRRVESHLLGERYDLSRSVILNARGSNRRWRGFTWTILGHARRSSAIMGWRSSPVFLSLSLSAVSSVFLTHSLTTHNFFYDFKN